MVYVFLCLIYFRLIVLIVTRFYLDNKEVEDIYTLKLALVL